MDAKPSPNPLAEHLTCALAAVPLRTAPDVVSEMGSTVLFGEGAVVLERIGHFCRVRLDFDSYEGWVDSRQFHADAAQPNNDAETWLCDDICALAQSPRRRLWLPLGAVLPRFSNGKFLLGEERFEFLGKALRAAETWDGDARPVLEQARRYLEAPYYWGGRTPFGIDCSGLAQMAFRPFGVRLLRDCVQQITQGVAIPYPERRAGDLAFFFNPKDQSHHVGILTETLRIIHCSSRGREDELDETGIRLPDGTYSHHFQEIRRMGSCAPQNR